MQQQLCDERLVSWQTTSSPAWLDSLVLTSIDPDRAAGVAIASVPLPPGGVVPTFAGMTAQALPLAWYPGPGDPRQALILGVADAAPDTLGLTVGSGHLPATRRRTRHAGRRLGRAALAKPPSSTRRRPA